MVMRWGLVCFRSMIIQSSQRSEFYDLLLGLIGKGGVGFVGYHSGVLTGYGLREEEMLTSWWQGTVVILPLQRPWQIPLGGRDRCK